MLTFFEYLRRRAYESIVAGVYGALETIDRDELPESLQKQEPSSVPDLRKLDQPSSAPQAAANDEAVADTASENLPAPRRRRGRPRKNSQS